MNYEWIIKKSAEFEQIADLSSKLNNLNGKLTNILINLGVDNFQKAKEFFRPDLSGIHDPFLMKDMLKAVERLQNAIENKKKILVYGDYDVDGTTSVAVVFDFLSNYTKNIDYYIPDRFIEGYGISIKGIDYAAENNFDLVIALDCGIKAVDKIEYANSKNIDFIICDHHTPGEVVPDAVAILNPKQVDCPYPYKELSGCGVGFKFMQAFAQRNNIDSKKVFEYLDLVAISIASDIVQITGENRILEAIGIEKLMNTNKNGLKALLFTAGLVSETDESNKNSKNISVSDIVFKIGPRINAAGRMDHANAAVELLTEKDFDSAREFANELNTLNSERKEIQDTIFNDVIDIFEKNTELLEKKSIVVHNEHWNKGIIGIVASKIVEKYYKPTIILTKSNGKWTGSGRSVTGFDLYNAIDKCSHLLHSFGGHKYAAGLTIEEENLQEFIDTFENIVSASITSDQLNPKLVISDILRFDEIDNRFLNVLSQFAPFGPGNMQPVFVTFNVRDTGQSIQIGKNFEHLRLEIKDESGSVLSATAFGMGHLFDYVQKYPFDIAYTIVENYWNGKKTYNLNVKDIRFKL